jgi:hypothetical protein
MSDWTTGDVVGQKRAIVLHGQVQAIAEDETRAAQIVRALNRDQAAPNLLLIRDELERLLFLAEHPLANKDEVTDKIKEILRAASR